MDRRRLAIGGIWVAALAAIVGIYLECEPEVADVRTHTADDAPTYEAGEDMAPPATRGDLEVAEDAGSPARYRGGARHTGRSPYRGPTRVARAWRYEAGGRITAQPVIGDDGTIYFGAHDHRMYAVSGDGEARWSVLLHQRIWSAGAVVGDTIYVGSDADVFFALDAADGSTRWRIRTEGDADGAPTIGEDGTIYFTAGPHLYAAGPSGEVRWRFRARGLFLLSAPAIDSDGTIYVASIDDRLYAVAPDGRMRWEYVTENDLSSSPVIGDDGTIYFGSDDGHVYALTRDGALRWRRHLDGYVRAPVALGHNDDVIAAVYGPRPRVVSLDARTGELRWYFSVTVSDSPELGVASGPIVDASGNVFFGAQDDYVYGLSGDGALRWIHQVGADVDSAPVLTEDGTLLVGCDDGFLYAITDAPPEDAGPEDAAVEDGGQEVR